jgi:hypothetical protein
VKLELSISGVDLLRTVKFALDLLGHVVCLVLEADGGRLVQVALCQVVLVYVPSLLQLVCLFAVVGVGSRPVQVLLIQHDLLVIPDKINKVLAESSHGVEVFTIRVTAELARCWYVI